MTNSADKINFIIEHIDPLGQGVFKNDGKVYFIPKTLPGESGSATIYKHKKGVHFAKLNSLTKKSDNRIKPECKHYSECAGCHFLHCDYETEIKSKFKNFTRMMSFLGDDIHSDSISAPQRLAYRNRVQLHYNKKIKKLGFIDASNRQIVEVPKCQIASPNIQKIIQELYQNNAWLLLCKNEPTKGHVEIYENEGEIKVNWNSKYSFGGFTQVFEQMNTKLNNLVNDLSRAKGSDIVFDIFGGNGNLSKSIEANKFIIDFYTKPKEQDNFYNIDLFSKGALVEFQEASDMQRADHFLIDPPRKGFPDLGLWAKHFGPQTITYVSCHPQTMARDLKNLTGYKITKAYMLDLFPSTFHFEACVFLEKSA